MSGAVEQVVCSYCTAASSSFNQTLLWERICPCVEWLKSILKSSSTLFLENVALQRRRTGWRNEGTHKEQGRFVGIPNVSFCLSSKERTGSRRSKKSSRTEYLECMTFQLLPNLSTAHITWLATFLLLLDGFQRDLTFPPPPPSAIVFSSIQTFQSQNSCLWSFHKSPVIGLLVLTFVFSWSWNSMCSVCWCAAGKKYSEKASDLVHCRYPHYCES